MREFTQVTYRIINTREISLNSLGDKMALEKQDKTKTKDKDLKKYIELNPVLDEEADKIAVISFGRMNPITNGHEKLADTLVKTAKRMGGTPKLYLSHTQDKKKNPLSYNDKIRLAKKAFGKIVTLSDSKTLIEVAKELSGNFNKLVVVAGSDRLKEFDTLLNKYNGKEYNFEDIKLVSSGDRDPDADDVSGMSASKLRSFAVNGDLEQFTKGLPSKLKVDANEIFNLVRKGMKLPMTEELEEERKPLTISQRRQRGLTMKRYKGKIAMARKRAARRKAPMEKLLQRAKRKARNIIKARLARNKSYSEMTPTEKIALEKRLNRIPDATFTRIARQQLPQVRKAEQERISQLNQSFVQFAESYYAGMADSTAEKRKAFFDKNAAMKDDDERAYRPAPGDSVSKTIPSEYTKRYHKMYKKEGNVNIDRRFKIYKEKKTQFENYSVKEELDFIRNVDNAEQAYIQEDHSNAIRFAKKAISSPAIQSDLYSEERNILFDIIETYSVFEDFSENVVNVAHILMENELNEDTDATIRKKSEETGISFSILKQVFNRGYAAWKSGRRPGTTPEQWAFARINSFATGGKTRQTADADLWKKHKEGLDEALTPEFRKKIQDKEVNYKQKMALGAMHNLVASKEGSKHSKGWAALQIVKSYDIGMTARELEKLYSSIHESVNPSDREQGTDSLTGIYMNDTPGQRDRREQIGFSILRDIKIGDRVKFKAHGLGLDTDYNYGRVVGSDIMNLRVRDDMGVLYVVKHRDAEKVTI
jgi:predicted ester cyclase